MRNEKWGWWIFAFLLVATLAATYVIEQVLPPSSAQWSGAAMALWLAFTALTIAAIRAPYCQGQFWPLALGMAAHLACLTAGFCARRWDLMLFGPNSHMFTILFPVTIPPALIVLWKHGRNSEGKGNASKDIQVWPYNPQTAFMTMYFVAIAHLILRFNQTTLATKLFLAFFAAVSIAAWRMPLRVTSAKLEELPATEATP